MSATSTFPPAFSAWRTQALTFGLWALLALIPNSAPATEPGPPAPADALAQTILALPQQEQKLISYFLDEDDQRILRTTGQFDFAKELARAILSSSPAPQPIYNKTKSGDGGLAALGGNVFCEGYYRQHINMPEFKNAGGGVDTHKLIKEQPWFEWNSARRSWTYRKTSVGPAILGQIKGTQSFFRGSTIEEWNVLRVYQILAQPQISAADGDELDQKLAAASRSRYLNREFQAALKALAGRSESLRKGPAPERHRAAESLFESYLKALNRHSWNAVFLTPNQRIAQSWAKTALIQWTVPQDELRAYLKNDALYVGIEFDYIEVAAADRASLLSYFKSARLIPKDQYLAPVFDDEVRF